MCLFARFIFRTALPYGFPSISRMNHDRRFLLLFILRWVHENPSYLLHLAFLRNGRVFALLCGVDGQQPQRQITLLDSWQALQPKPTPYRRSGWDISLVVAEWRRHADGIAESALPGLIRGRGRHGDSATHQCVWVIVLSWMPIAESEIAPN